MIDVANSAAAFLTWTTEGMRTKDYYYSNVKFTIELGSECPYSELI